MTIKDLCIVKTNLPNADFWVVRKGSKKDVGKPTRVFNKEHFGIKVVRTESLNEMFLYYLFLHLHSIGYFQPKATGTLELKNIKVDDIKNISLLKI
jgi:hypothetical protein